MNTGRAPRSALFSLAGSETARIHVHARPHIRVRAWARGKIFPRGRSTRRPRAGSYSGTHHIAGRHPTPLHTPLAEPSRSQIGSARCPPARARTGIDRCRSRIPRRRLSRTARSGSIFRTTRHRRLATQTPSTPSTPPTPADRSGAAATDGRFPDDGRVSVDRPTDRPAAHARQAHAR